MSIVTLLFFGDIVGNPGRTAIHHALPELKKRFDPDFVIANAENSAGGSGITPSTMHKITSYGVNVLTSGDHFFRNKEYAGVASDPRVLRPANYPKAAIGRGYGIYEARGGAPVAVINMLGRIFMEPHRCPFETADEVLAALNPRPKIIFVDMHCEATSEKVGMGWFLDGRVSAVVGTHTHIQTADERILPKGTAYLTDAGMCGPYDSIIGRIKDAVLHKLTTGMPARFEVATEDIRACGVCIKVDAETGKATHIERFQVPVRASESQGDS